MDETRMLYTNRDFRYNKTEVNDMKKRLCAALLLMATAFALPAQAAMSIDTAMIESGENRIVSMIMASPAQQEYAQEETEQMQALADANMLIQTRFPLAQYLIAMNRVGASAGGQGIRQELRLYQDGKSASIAVLWQGEQADGRSGSSVQSLALDLDGGGEIALDMLFADPQAAFAAMETIIEEKIVGGISDYMEYADLLPMPTDSFSYDENGLTVYYPQDRYLYFSGRSGAVHFAWHEIDHLIAEGSPVYALSRELPAGALDIEEQVRTGKLPGALAFGLGDRLGDALDTLTLLSDPDYTRESLVYAFEDERLRGFALEIPKYAETRDEDTHVSAVRSSSTALFGLVTEETTRAMAVSLLGEPEQKLSFDAGDAADMLLVPGESLLYSLGGHVLQLHFDIDGVLDTVLLRLQMPEPML